MEHGNKDITRDFDNKEVIRDVFALFVPEGLELCGVDMLVRLGKGSLFGCRNCVFRDMLKEEVCLSEVKQEIRGLI